MKRFIVLPGLVLLAIVALAGCEHPGKPGPMQRGGAAVDQGVSNAQSSLGRASQATGQALDRAGQAVGAAANRAGDYLHNKLMPEPAQPSPGTAAAGAPLQSPGPPESGASAPVSVTP